MMEGETFEFYMDGLMNTAKIKKAEHDGKWQLQIEIIDMRDVKDE